MGGVESSCPSIFKVNNWSRFVIWPHNVQEALKAFAAQPNRETENRDYISSLAWEHCEIPSEEAGSVDVNGKVWSILLSLLLPWEHADKIFSDVFLKCLCDSSTIDRYSLLPKDIVRWFYVTGCCQYTHIPLCLSRKWSMSRQRGLTSSMH